MPERAIQIVGQNLLQNTLLSAYLRETVGARCDCRATVEAAASTRATEAVEELVLIDCYRCEPEVLLSLLRSDGLKGISGKRPALFNLRPDTSTELTALRSGIRGFFYQDESLASLAKGVVALFADDYWVSRKLLVDFLATPIHALPAAQHYPGLTLRESELLSLLVLGLSNQRIAERLFISVPTVKSHLSSIYRKIKVGNRLAALCWAEKARGGSAPTFTASM
jgi:LuxR family transcriptional regulator, positive regulator of biofilm formation